MLERTGILLPRCTIPSGSSIQSMTDGECDTKCWHCCLKVRQLCGKIHASELPLNQAKVQLCHRLHPCSDPSLILLPSLPISWEVHSINHIYLNPCLRLCLKETQFKSKNLLWNYSKSLLLYLKMLHEFLFLFCGQYTELRIQRKVFSFHCISASLCLL